MKQIHRIQMRFMAVAGLCAGLAATSAVAQSIIIGDSFSIGNGSFEYDSAGAAQVAQNSGTTTHMNSAPWVDGAVDINVLPGVFTHPLTSQGPTARNDSSPPSGSWACVVGYQSGQNANTKGAFQNTGYEIASTNEIYNLGFWFQGSVDWSSNEKLTVTLFVSDDDTLAGDLSLLAHKTFDGINDSWQYFSATGVGSVDSADMVGRDLWIAILPHGDVDNNSWGRIDDITLSAEVPTVPATSLTAWFEYNETGVNTTFVNTVPPLNALGSGGVNGNVSGFAGSGVSFDGSGSALSIAASTATQPLGDFTIVTWIRPSSFSDWQRFVDSSSSFGSISDGYCLMVRNGTNNDNFRFLGKGALENADVTHSRTLTANQWWLLVARYDADGMASVNVLQSSDPVDAAFVASNTESTDAVGPIRYATNTPTIIGGSSNLSLNFNGTLDETAWYDETLSDADVADLFNNGVFDSPSPNITLFSTNDQYVQPGDVVTLTWDINNAGTQTISQIGQVGASGSTQVVVNATTTFTLSSTNATRSASADVTVEVGPARPNIIVFLADDYGPHDTSVPFLLNGNGVPVEYNFNTFYQTPNLETLAASGMRFVSAYAQSVCSPTRAGILTGRNSIRHGVTDWVNSNDQTIPAWRMDGIDASDVTLPQQLQAENYRTIHIGKAHLGTVDVTLHGFDVNIAGSRWGLPRDGYIGTPGYGADMPGLETYDGTEYLTQVLALEANKQLQTAAEDGVPFFLHMSFYAVHSPFQANPNATGNYSGATSSTHQGFATMVEGMDLAIGSIMQKLDELGLAEDTLIIFLGDNGSDSPATRTDDLPSGSFSDWPMRGKKASKWEGGSRIPFLATWGSNNATNVFQQALTIPANSIETDIVTSWDIPATLLDVAGISPADNFGEDSHSLVPYLKGTAGTHRPQEIVCHYPHEHRSDYFSWIRKGSMKLIYNYQSNTHELYDLENDPTESTDLSSSRPDEALALTRALAQKVDAMWEETTPLFPPVSSPAPDGNLITVPNSSGVDADGDGLDDIAEDSNLNGLVDGLETDPDDPDTDKDGSDDHTEIRLNLDPLNPDERFTARIQLTSPNSLLLTWPSAQGTTFNIWSSSSLTDTEWMPHTTNIPGSNSNETSWPVNITEPSRFYRLELTD